jgi:hypothetical protein
MRSVTALFITALVIAACALPAPSALGQGRISLAVPEFTNENAELLQVTGDALVSGRLLRLTREVNNLSGTAMYHTPQNLGDNRSFSAYFTLKMWRPSGAQEKNADGIAFLVQNNLGSLPGEGKDIGYRGAGQSLNIEFDTFHNGEAKDPDNNHVGINLHGDNKSIATVKAPFVLNDGTVLHAWVDYDGDPKVVQIRLSKSAERPKEPILVHSIDLSEVLNPAVHVGFAAATGSFNQQHEIHSFFFHNELLAEGIDTSVMEYSME